MRVLRRSVRSFLGDNQGGRVAIDVVGGSMRFVVQKWVGKQQDAAGNLLRGKGTVGDLRFGSWVTQRGRYKSEAAARDAIASKPNAVLIARLAQDSDRTFYLQQGADGQLVASEVDGTPIPVADKYRVVRETDAPPPPVPRIAAVTDSTGDVVSTATHSNGVVWPNGIVVKGGR